MPKTTKGGKPKQEELPSTLQRSGAKAQRTFAKAHDSAVESYGEGERANRTAYSALKHTHEKGDSSAFCGPDGVPCGPGSPSVKGIPYG